MHELPDPAVVPYEVFRARFQPEIRVWLNWALLEGQVTCVSVYVHESVREFATIFAPWYRSRTAQEAGFADPDARPWRFSELTTDRPGLSREHRQKIDDIMHVSAEQPILLSIASLDLGDGQALVLDGNHRLAAAMRLATQGWHIKVTEFRLTTPLSADLLPDLTHWLK